MQTIEDDDAVIEFLEDSGSNNGTTDSNGNGQELVTRRMIKEEKFCTTFGLSLNEKVLKSFPCFLVAEILIQGTMVVTERHICFYSNIPGLRRNIKIRFSDIVRLSKEKVYAFFPTGIGVQSRREKTVFSYVTSRDKLLQLLLSQCAAYSELDTDFGSSVRGGGSSVDEAPMDGQASSRDASVLNDEDSGILVAPTVTTTASTDGGGGSLDSSPTEDSAAAAGDSDSRRRRSRRRADALSFSGDSTGDRSTSPDGSRHRSSAAVPAAAAAAATSSMAWRRWKQLLLDWDGLPNRHVISFIAFLVLLCAIVIVYLSYRLNSLQQQLLFIISMRTGGQSQSEVDHLNHRLGGIVETLGGLQEKLGSLRHLLHSLHPVDNR